MCDFPSFNKFRIAIVTIIIVLLQLLAISVGVGLICWLALWMIGD